MNNKILNINKNINRNLGNRPVQSIPIHWAKKKIHCISGDLQSMCGAFQILVVMVIPHLKNNSSIYLYLLS